MAKSYFYCKDTSPADEPHLPDFSPDSLQINANMKAKCSEDARPKVDSLLRRLRALVAHRLGGMDLVLCWTTWRIQPLSPRTRLIVEYTRCVTDSLCMIEKQASTTNINRLVKKLTGKLVKDQENFGLSPFCVTTPPPAVSHLTLVFRLYSCCISTPLLSDFIFLNFV